MSTKLYISVAEQKLTLRQNNRKIKEYRVSTASLGVGQKKDSNKNCNFTNHR